MAVHWRIRHKLMLGLGLVVCIIALLLLGTINGMMAARATMKTFDSKLAELREAQRFKEAVINLDPRQREVRVDAMDPAVQPPAVTTGNIKDDLDRLLTGANHAREALGAYEDRLRDTMQHGRETDAKYKQELIGALRESFTALDQAAKKAGALVPEAEANLAGLALLDDQTVHEAIGALARSAGDLHEAIYNDLYIRISTAKGDYSRSLWFVIVTCVVGVGLLAVLLHWFYRWVAGPIHDLQRGVVRVAQGNFDQVIEVHSGDEMEELAAAFNDMTGRLSEMYRDLARQVNERSRQLVRSERLASVGFLAAGVAHEINNPLASIAFCSEALEGRFQSLIRSIASPANPLDQEVIVKYLKMIQQEAFRCKAITQRLLEFSRGGERTREPTDLVELVQSVLDMVQHLQNCKGKEIILRQPDRLVARVNGQEIKSVVLNLVVNALDSMDDGGTLTISLGQHAGMAEIEFADNGCGMSPEILENIFEPFYTRSRTGKGTGLGLSISHRVLSQHGGEIEAASPGLDQGSTFTVRVPLQPPAEAYRDELLSQAA